MKKGIVLSKRMEAVVNMVLPQSLVVSDKMQREKRIKVADIGCDHAYVSIALIERKIAEKVIAMDVRKGPLAIAAKNVAEYGMKEQIELRLSDGMEKLVPGEADTIIIAGMGGLLMEHILERGMEQVSEQAEEYLENNISSGKSCRPVLVLQPQSDICKVREYLQKHAYVIEREQMLVDEEKYYTVIRAVPEERQSIQGDSSSLCPQTQYREVELVYGRYGLQHKDAVLFEFLQKEEKNLAHIAEKIQCLVDKAECGEGEVPEKTRKRLETVRKEIELNREARSYFILVGEDSHFYKW